MAFDLFRGWIDDAEAEGLDAKHRGTDAKRRSNDRDCGHKELTKPGDSCPCGAIAQ